MFRKLLIGLIIIVSGYSSCDIFPNVNCDDCYSNKPDSAEIKMSFSINSENPIVPLVVYKGKVEDRKVEWIDTTNKETFYLYVKIDQYYSVVATYKSGARTIYAVDGDKITTRYVTDACKEDCYIITHNELDVRLKD